MQYTGIKFLTSVEDYSILYQINIEEIRKSFETEPITNKITEHMQPWKEYFQQMKVHRFPKAVLNCSPRRKRGRGPPMRVWRAL